MRPEARAARRHRLPSAGLRAPMDVQVQAALGDAAAESGRIVTFGLVTGSVALSTVRERLVSIPR